MDTPSPVTPTYPIEPLEPPKTINPYDGCYPTSTYPVLQPGEYTEQTHNASSIGHDTLVEDVCEHVRPTFRSTNLISPSNTIAPKIPQASSKPMTKRNKYPCPHASRFNCTDTFTTSGHAARHGKKHTGEKNILCPHCNKAFTRKDNMKQHQRTHQGRRDSGKFPKERDAMRRERLKSEQQARMGNNTSPTVPDVGTATDDIVTIEGMKDEDRARFLTPFDNSPALRVDTTLSYNRISADLESPSCRLDALAIAASGMSFNPGGTRRNHQSDG
ncbi:MAG: hypothetical protein M1830_004569, partial [Pleopsidium flavum]